MSELEQQVQSAAPWINTSSYSTPVFVVPATQPTVAVTLDGSDAALSQAWQQVPIPAGAHAAGGSDEHMVVWQPSTDRMWEFWSMHRAVDGWYAGWGGMMNNVSSNPGYFNSPSYWGATATSLPLLAGLIRPSELAAGHIDHALALAIPHARAGVYAWPAQRTDGSDASSAAIPEGQRFRLDPTLDVWGLGLPPIVRMMALAAQKYGIIVRDQAGSVSFYGEDAEAEGLGDPYDGASGFYGGRTAGQLMASFPWSHLQAVQGSLSGQ